MREGDVRILLLHGKDICLFSKYAHTFLRILLVRSYLSAYSPNTLIYVNPTAPWLFVDQDQKYFRSQITILHGFERAKKPFHATVPLSSEHRVQR
jgi:hypothetical protein